MCLQPPPRLPTKYARDRWLHAQSRGRSTARRLREPIHRRAGRHCHHPSSLPRRRGRQPCRTRGCSAAALPATVVRSRAARRGGREHALRSAISIAYAACGSHPMRKDWKPPDESDEAAMAAAVAAAAVPRHEQPPAAPQRRRGRSPSLATPPSCPARPPPDATGVPGARALAAAVTAAVAVAGDARPATAAAGAFADRRATGWDRARRGWRLGRGAEALEVDPEFIECEHAAHADRAAGDARRRLCQPALRAAHPRRERAPRRGRRGGGDAPPVVTTGRVRAAAPSACRCRRRLCPTAASCTRATTSRAGRARSHQGRRRAGGGRGRRRGHHRRCGLGVPWGPWKDELQEYASKARL